MPKLPYELIDKILINVNDIELASKLNRKYVIKKLYSEKTMLLAAENGYLKLMKCLYKIGKRCDELYINFAILRGQLEIIKFLHSEGHKFERITMFWAATEGNLEMVKFLYNAGVECEKSYMIAARNNGHREVANYLSEVYGGELTLETINIIEIKYIAIFIVVSIVLKYIGFL